MELYEEDLRTELTDLVEKYAKPLCGKKLSEDDAVEIADNLRSEFHSSVGGIVAHDENERLKKLV